MSFGSFLADARKKVGLSQKDLAALVKKDDGASISPQYLNDIEHDRRNPPSDYILRQLASTLNISLDYLGYLAGRMPEDVQNIKEPEKIEAALKAFRKAIKGDK